MKKVDTELCSHFAGDDHYNVLASVCTNSKEVMIDLHRTSPDQLRRIIFKDARIDEGIPSVKFYINMMEWCAEGKERSVYINAVSPRNPKT